MKNSFSVFDEQYKKRGIGAQRMYPNEGLLRFVGGQGFLEKIIQMLRF